MEQGRRQVFSAAGKNYICISGQESGKSFCRTGRSPAGKA